MSRVPIWIITILLMAFTLISPQRTQAGEIYTYTDKDGITVITDRPIPEKYKAKAERLDSNNEMGRRSGNGAANREIEALIYRLENDPKNRVTQNMGSYTKTGGLKKHVQKQIVELRKAQLRGQGNQEEDGLEMRNQRTDVGNSKVWQQNNYYEDYRRKQERERNKEYPYESSLGTRYKYDLSKPLDQTKYEVDPAAQLKDSINPKIELDRSLYQHGGGAEW